MGCTVEARCLDCGEEFTVDHGGGFVFHLVRCNQCGQTRQVYFWDLEELHDRYLKGLDGPYCIVTAEHDKEVRENSPVEPISEKDYFKGVEAKAGKCRCGGKYLIDAPARCPECRSANIKESDDPIIMYD